MHKIWPALSQQHFVEEPVENSTQNLSLPMLTPDRQRHLSGFSERFSDFSGNSTMSAIIPHVGEKRVGKSSSTLFVERVVVLIKQHECM